MGRVYERQNAWWIDFKDERGVRIRRKISTDKKIAQDSLKAYEGKVAMRVNLGIIEDDKISFSDYADQWLAKVSPTLKPNTQRSWAGMVRKWFKPAFPGALRAITAADVGALKNKMIEAGLKPGSVNTTLIGLKRLFGSAVDDGVLSKNPCRDAQGKVLKECKALKAPRGRLRWLTVEEIDRLLAACAQDKKASELVPFTVIALNTGCRRGEVLGIDVKRVDRQGHKVTITDRKNGRDLVVKLNAEAYAAVMGLSKDKIAGPVFRIHVRDLSRVFARALRLAKIEDFCIHGTRHTFAAQFLLQKRGTLYDLQKALGHESIKSTEIYAHISEEHLAEAVDGLVMGGAK